MELSDWLRSLAAELDVTDATPDSAGTTTLLDVAREAAHQVERKSAPLTTFLVGVAVGRGAALDEAATATLALLGSGSPAAPPA